MRNHLSFEERFLARTRCECHFGFFEVVVPAAIAYIATSAAAAGASIAAGAAAAGTAAAAAGTAITADLIAAGAIIGDAALATGYAVGNVAGAAWAAGSAAAAAEGGGIFAGIGAAEGSISGSIATALAGGVMDTTIAGVTLAEMAGEGLVGATVGAGLGAGEAAILGGDPGKGALSGAISGGTLSAAGPVVGSALGAAGVGGAKTIGNVVAGAAGGAAGAGATGADPRLGAAGGAVSGGVKSYLAGDLSGGSTGAVTTGDGGTVGGAPAPEATPGVESVTVTAAPGVLSPTLAGTVPDSGAPTTPGGAKAAAAPASVTDPGVVDLSEAPETAVVSALRPTPVASALLPPIVAGTVQQDPLQPQQQPQQQPQPQQPQQPQQQPVAAQQAGVTQPKTTQQVGITSGQPQQTGPEQVVVPGVRPQVGITPTAAGLASSDAAFTGTSATSSGAGTGDDIEKKYQDKAPFDAAAGDTPSSGSSDSGYLDKLATNAENFLANPAVLIGGGLLAADLLGGFGGKGGAGNLAGGADANAKEITDAAARDKSIADTTVDAAKKELSNADALKEYLMNGTLPPGMQAALDAQREAAIASTTQMYSNLGMNQGNTSFMQDIASINRAAAGAQAQMAEQIWGLGDKASATATRLFELALSGSNADANIYTGLLNANLAADSNLSSNVQRFAASLATMGGAAKTAALGSAGVA